MNKVVIRELKTRHIIVYILLYSLYVIIGFMLLSVCKERLFDVMDHSYAFFFILAFLTLFAYFINRRPIDYELLFLGFINVAAGTFALGIRAYPSAGFILSDAVLLYAILNILNKIYSCKLLIDDRDVSFFPKVAVTILLFFIGLLVVSLLRDEIEAGILIMGYYFAIFGLLSLLEPLTKIVCGNNSIKSFVFDFLSYGNKEREEKKEREEAKNRVKEIPSSKPVVKKTRKVATKKKTTTKKKATAKKTTTKKTKATK
jgi:hypothetical protein